MEHDSASDPESDGVSGRRPGQYVLWSGRQRRTTYLEVTVDEELRARIVARAGGAPDLVLEQGGLTVCMSSPGGYTTASADSAALVAAEALYTAAAAWRDAIRVHHEAQASGAALLRPIALSEADGDAEPAETVLALLLTLLRAAGGRVALPVDEVTAAQRDVRSGVVWGLVTDWLDARTVAVRLTDSHRGNAPPSDTQ